VHLLVVFLGVTAAEHATTQGLLAWPLECFRSLWGATGFERIRRLLTSLCSYAAVRVSVARLSGLSTALYMMTVC